MSEENRYNWARALTSNLVISDPRRAFDFAVKQQIPEDTNFKGEGLEARVYLGYFISEYRTGRRAFTRSA